MIEIDQILQEKMRSLGEATYKVFLCSEVIHHWNELLDENISAQVKPVTIEHGVLFVNVENSAFKDQLKFYAEEIIDAINENFGKEEPLVKEIRLAAGYQIANMPPEKESPAQVEEPAGKLEKIILTDEEIKRCEEEAGKISNETLRATVLETLLSQAKLQKLQLENGWHKCAKCGTLCPPNEIFCEVCRIKARETMVNELFKIFYNEPCLKAQDAQKLLLKKMPHMREECSLPAVESARTSLIQKIASHIRFGDEESDEVLKLVMLEKRLPSDKITPAIIKRTLYDMQFNLSETPKFPRRS